MTYWAINAVFLVLVAAAAGAALLLAWSRRRAGRASSPGRPLVERVRAAALATVVLLVMTAVFDNVMIGVGLVGYDEARISGVKIGVAPLEDFAYAVAALVLLPSVWSLLGGRRAPREPTLVHPRDRARVEASASAAAAPAATRDEEAR
ncbi:lycopene cyclase domain-containing protein [Frigoribacterium sp. PhB160]|uniref:lycopene cyclase domain-containing protein n=1 Tax=Frigoribacterium sp. PhB160 TaxID=2485192 RepID=UPI000F486D8B|nr:lycopene cyclase domain-containing protein [Frigoribacterium sp. PhB160]ROS57942.1 lycopene cyclase domain-containing protein [Frigoribacterium sp. PhB160]